jgi:hypothetical protein
MFVILGGLTQLLSLLTILPAFLYSLRYLSVYGDRDNFRLGQKYMRLFGFISTQYAPYIWIDDTLYDCMILMDFLFKNELR